MLDNISHQTGFVKPLGRNDDSSVALEHDVGPHVLQHHLLDLEVLLVLGGGLRHVGHEVPVLHKITVQALVVRVT